jgi:hypothetical protein
MAALDGVRRGDVTIFVAMRQLTASVGNSVKPLYCSGIP